MEKQKSETSLPAEAGTTQISLKSPKMAVGRVFTKEEPIPAEITCVTPEASLAVPIRAHAKVRLPFAIIRPDFGNQTSLAAMLVNGKWTVLEEDSPHVKDCYRAFQGSDAVEAGKIEDILAETLRRDHGSVMKQFPDFEITGYRNGEPSVRRKQAKAIPTQLPVPPDQPAVMAIDSAGEGLGDAGGI